MGWSREAVKNYVSLRKIDDEAWAVVGTTFSFLVPSDEEDAVPINGTAVPKTPFTERLLRDILDLCPAQQLDLCRVRKSRFHGFVGCNDFRICGNHLGTRVPQRPPVAF